MRWIKRYLPQILGNGWEKIRESGDGAQYKNRMTHQTLIVSGATELDGKRWVHLSTAFPDRLPTWGELVEIKEWVLGFEAKAIQVIPPRSQHVNIHPYMLHFFACVDEDPLPDFTRGTKSL